MASRKTSRHIDDEVLRETRGDGIKLEFIRSLRLSIQPAIPANASLGTALGEDVDTEVENNFIVLIKASLSQSFSRSQNELCRAIYSIQQSSSVRCTWRGKPLLGKCL